MKLILPKVTGVGAVSVINSNFDKLSKELQNKVLYRKNPLGEPNSLETDIDANSRNIINVGEVRADKVFVDGGEIFNNTMSEALASLTEDLAEAAEVSALAALGHSADAALSEYNAGVSEMVVVEAQTAINHRYRGALSADPATRTDGSANVAGDEYFNTSANLLKRWNGATWQASDISTANLAASDGGSLSGFDFAMLPTAINNIQWALALTGMNGVPVLRFILPGEWAAIAAGTSTFDATAAIQAAIDSKAGPINVILPVGKLRKTGTIYLRRSKVRIVGQGVDVSIIEHIDAAGSIGFSGDTNTINSLLTYSSCALLNFSMNGGAGLGPAATDPTICVDLTSFSYGNFDINITNKRANGIMYYGQGNAGVSPYYNRISATALIGGDGAGGTNYTQIAFKFAQGAFTGGSNGPNANIITNVGRAASLLGFCDLQAGVGNLFSNISVESLNDYCFRFNLNAAVQTGTSTGGGGAITLLDTGKAWTVNAYVNAGVKITSGLGAGQVRSVASNSATVLTVREPWGVLPDATSTYEIFTAKTNGNKATNVRMEGLSSLNPDFIYALPGCDKTEISQCEVISLGAGLYVRDESGSPRNSWYGGSKFTMTHALPNIGPNANINLYERGGALGGIRLAGAYVMEWIKVSTTTAATGDLLTVTLDVGGSAPATGSDMSMAVKIPNGQAQGMAMPGGAEKIPRDGTNRGIFLNVATGPAFSATADAQVTWCATLI